MVETPDATGIRHVRNAPLRGGLAVKRLALAGLLLLAAACSGSTTQYAGTVMSEADPESEGSLRLTLYSRTDTSFSGVIDLGPPAHGTGSAYAWHEGSELHVVSVGAESGDTIRWISRLTDEGLGGRFEVVGGKRTGESGTWRARLVAGPPATVATLRGARAFPLPRWTALLSLLLVIGIGLAVGRWILRAPGGPSPATTESRPFSSPRSGIGGWLAFFAGARGIATLFFIARVGRVWSGYFASIGLAAAVHGMQPLIVAETTIGSLLLPLNIVGLVLLLRRSRYAPRFWFAFLLATGAYLLADHGAMALIEPQLRRLVGAAALADSDASSKLATVFRDVGINILWALYWVRSERVRKTFGAAALDRAVMEPTSTVDIVTELQATPAVPRARRWRRVAGRTVGIVLVGCAALLAYGLFATRATPYSVPAGADIRSTIAGRWTWDSDSAGCAGAHTIAFADGGRVMTITSGDISVGDAITEYDILSASRSTIRGAIRGEKRMTKEGKPVVWDLVLTGPDEYRWKRADWPSTPWSYTGRIRRCPAPPVAAATTR